VIFENKKVFITGATGFIGGRIAEKLWLDWGGVSKCLIHNFNNAARLSRLPVEIHCGDVLEKGCLNSAIQEGDVIFHCAYGKTSDKRLNKKINEEGTENVCEVSLEKGVKRLIFLSSIAVYGEDPPEIVTENTPVKISNDEYGNSKIAAEKICMDYHKKGLPVTVIRPTIVYGPFSPIWTVGVIKRIKLGGWEKVKGLEGICNPVYIDDLVEALFLCVKNENSIGEIFIISGDQTITWNDYYEKHFQIAKLNPPAPISSQKRKIKSLINRLVQLNLNILRKYFEDQIVNTYLLMEERFPGLTARINRAIRGGIKDNEIKLFSRKSVYLCNKAKSLLGYHPRSFEEGMEITRKWLEHHEYI